MLWSPRKLTFNAFPSRRNRRLGNALNVSFRGDHSMNHRTTTLLLTAMSLLVLPLVAYGDDNDGPAHAFRANLQGRNEAPLTLSAARGRLALTVNATDTSVHFVLQY